MLGLKAGCPICNRWTEDFDEATVVGEKMMFRLGSLKKLGIFQTNIFPHVKILQDSFFQTLNLVMLELMCCESFSYFMQLQSKAENWIIPLNNKRPHYKRPISSVDPLRNCLSFQLCYFGAQWDTKRFIVGFVGSPSKASQLSIVTFEGKPSF